MAVSGKYGRLYIPKIGENEPVFILRAQDNLAAPTIRVYRALLRFCDSPMAEEIQKEIDAFEQWSRPNNIPD